MDRDRMASDQASGQEAARFSLLRRRVGGSIDSNSRQNLGAGGKDSDRSGSDRDGMASDQASGQEAARFSLLRRRVGGSIDSNSRQNLGAGGKDSDRSG